MVSKITQSLFMMSFLALSGCNEESTDEGEAIFCTEEMVPSLRVEVFDKETGFPNACGSTLWVIRSGGDFTQITNEAGDNCLNTFTFEAAFEEEGIFDLYITKEGYMDWHHYAVNVSSNVCHVNTVTLQAYLEK